MRRAKLFVVLALIVLLLLSVTPVTLAGKTWCSTEPIVKINGVTVLIAAYIDGAPASAFTPDNPLTYTIAVPPDVEVEVLHTSQSPYEVVHVVPDPGLADEVQVSLHVPAQVNFTVLLVAWRGHSYVAVGGSDVSVTVPLPGQ